MNLLIVDDEILEVTVIEQMIDRNKFGITQIYKAYSMRQAVEILNKYEIAILLSDIEMPKGSGLQLIEWVREKNLEIVPIFLTSYAKFEYAQKALMLQVRDYLLKPVEKGDLEKSLSLAVDLIQNQKKNKQNERYARYWKNGQKSDSPVDLTDFRQTGNTADLITNIQKYISENPEKDLNRSTLAARVYLHPDYLSHIFKTQTGTSISDYIIQVRIECAKNLLLKTNLNISEVALRCGYGNTAYFTKLFKSIVHMTPKEYRRTEINGKNNI